MSDNYPAGVNDTVINELYPEMPDWYSAYISTMDDVQEIINHHYEPESDSAREAIKEIVEVRDEINEVFSSAIIDLTKEAGKCYATK